MYAATFGCKIYAFWVHVYGSVGCKVCGCWVQVYGEFWVHVYAFWVHVYGSVGYMYAIVGCKYAETFGCMSMPFHTFRQCRIKVKWSNEVQRQKN